ncbi:SOS response-associated peptidase family protein [Chitinolyticbacter meiyuanensis]|uniref:SOS response-associated peptidase family protein n=1 Tax=Chitinolyticbacter meiyuanensis TaxID=682798 RepID=UPI0016522EB0|nr:SOS response-associated peptidase family protein [Chitinolyticbacter meiyuanensis]
MDFHYLAPTRQALEYYFQLGLPAKRWSVGIQPEEEAPVIIRNDEGQPQVVMASFGLIPGMKRPLDVEASATEVVAGSALVSEFPYQAHWDKGLRCLIPMMAFIVHNAESAKPRRWCVGTANGTPFAAAGVWRPWREDDGATRYSFTLATIPAASHPVMKLLPVATQQRTKVMPIVIPEAFYDAWLTAERPEEVQSLLSRMPAELMTAAPCPARVAR